ncbi:MAG: DUF5985 family protein [Bacteriovoracia bacterium]
MNALYLFLSGAVMMGLGVAGLFFFRFWRQTSDRLFLIFGLAFSTMALERVIILFVATRAPRGEDHALVYVFRLIAFLMIIYGVIDKNRTIRD